MFSKNTNRFLAIAMLALIAALGQLGDGSKVEQQRYSQQ